MKWTFDCLLCIN